METVRENLLKIKYFLIEEEKLNKSVEAVILAKNIQRIAWFQFAAITINLVLIFSFVYLFYPTSEMEERWRIGVICVHLVSLVTVAIISFLLIITKRKKNPILAIKIIQNIFIVYTVLFGFAIILVDQPRTANIVPYLIVCMILCVGILRKPIYSCVQFLISYAMFFYIIGLNETDAMALITNRVNGFVFVILGVFMAIILWQAERNNILQKIKIEEQQKELETLAYYDELTGLFNRRKWIELLNEEYERMKRYNHQSSILILDIDNFKRINDQYGHPAGDHILQKIAQLIKNELRTCDKIGRWGGEEFIIMLFETPIKHGVTVGEKLRNEIEKMSVQFESHLINVTLSIGVAGLDCEEDFLTCYKKADQALYLAKNNGRNRVEFCQ